jgi:predicted RNA methylase
LDIDNVLLLAELFLRGMYYYKVSDRVYVRFYGGYVSSPSAERPSLLSEPLEKLYRVFSYSGRVLDVGGYLGETAFLFKKWGADEVVVYEPDHVLARHARETMFLNGVKGVVYELFVNCSDSHNSISWAEVLKEKFDIAKVDCEGCENGLLSLPAECLRKVPKWIIECHSSKTFRQLAEKFLSAGFKVTLKLYLWSGGYSVLSRKTSFHYHTKVPQGCLLILYAHVIYF